MKLVLFDPENVLLKPQNRTRYLLEAFLNIYGIVFQPEELDPKNLEGKTVRQIVEDMLLPTGNVTKGTIDSRMPQFIEELQYTYQNDVGLEKVFDTNKLLCDGSKQLLGKLAQKQAMLGIASGNLHDIIALDLNRAGIMHFFKISEYGNAHADIFEILKHAIKQAEANGFNRDDGQIYVISSNPSTIKSANDLGAIGIGISSGSFSHNELSGAGAKLVAKSIKEGSVARHIM